MSQLSEHCSSPRAEHWCVSSDLHKKAKLIGYFPPKQAALFLSFRVYSVASHLMYTLAKGLFIWTFSRVSVQMMNLQTFQMKGSSRCICRPSSPPSVYPASIFSPTHVRLCFWANANCKTRPKTPTTQPGRTEREVVPGNANCSMIHSEIWIWIIKSQQIVYAVLRVDSGGLQQMRVYCMCLHSIIVVL